MAQRYALFTLLRETNNDDYSGVSECDWPGVVCTAMNISDSGSVEDMSENELQETVQVITEFTHRGNSGFSRPFGSIPTDLGLLTNLVRFEVTGNALTGTLPQALSHWTKLQHLDISNNQLNISALLARDDDEEDSSIDNNTLLGDTWIDLVHLDVHSNQAFGDFGRRSTAGSLPSTFGQAWTNLVHLDASDAALVGSLPNTIGQAWTQLRYFNVSGNQLTGSLPESMADWTQLETADLHNNGLVGTVPLDLCRNAVLLTTLCLESTRVNCTAGASTCCSCQV